MVDGHEQAGASAAGDQPSEEEMRAAYEAELNRITSSEMILQTAVSLLNIGGRRLGLAPTPSSPPAAAERDLEQVRDAIDGASALLPILERRMPRELGPLRDAVAQLQVAYAREAQSAGSASGSSASTSSTTSTTPPAPPAEQATPSEQQEPPTEGEQQGPGPAQASGRLWVPGR
ncbi:MAG: hypothetical protein WAN93_03890 [Solirubrobacteraceae bacterium]